MEVMTSDHVMSTLHLFGATLHRIYISAPMVFSHEVNMDDPVILKSTSSLNLVERTLLSTGVSKVSD